MKKQEKIIFLHSIFIPFPKLQLFFKPYLVGSYNIDLKNGWTIKISCKKYGKIKCWVACKTHNGEGEEEAGVTKIKLVNN